MAFLTTKTNWLGVLEKGHSGCVRSDRSQVKNDHAQFLVIWKIPENT